jgi:hypothetical protein
MAVQESRKPEPWEISAPGPFVTIDSDRGMVALHSLGDDRYRLTAPGHDEQIVGFDEAREAAHALAQGGDERWRVQ